MTGDVSFLRDATMPNPTKRMRLSSPTFDDQVQILSQDDIHLFDKLDPQLSQSRRDDDDNPFGAKTDRIYSAFKPAAVFSRPTLPADAPDDDPQLSDDPPPDVDYAAWFKSDFGPAAAAMPSFQRPSLAGASDRSLFVPSATALRGAEEKMRKWQEDDHQASTQKEPDSPQIASPPRPMFTSASSALLSVLAPETPCPKPSTSQSALQSLGGKQQTKSFKPPSICASPSVPSHRQVSVPSIGSPLCIPQPSSSTLPSQTTPAILPLRPSSVVNHATTQRTLGLTPRRGAGTRQKFVTPFKAGQHGTASKLDAGHVKPPTTPSMPMNRIYPPSIPPSTRLSKQVTVHRVFDLSPTPSRRTLAVSGLCPQAYTSQQLEDMGINLKELGQVNLRTAPFYAFTTRSCTPPSSLDTPSPLVLGRSAVLEELFERGCTFAKQAWVDNHWPLILWKLAGMAALDPTSERDPLKKRWCWQEVMRQFMYRYERDLNGSSRPPFRLITTRDASAESPMVLCVSDIIWPASGVQDDIARVQAHPEFELTDGWYRLRARIDAPLARAVKKGKIKIGRKIALAGAKLLAERKDGCEILDAYNSNVLLLTGNSTHMAPWHAKLGFKRGPMIATLSSLTADGGNVAVMMFTVTKAYPLAYIEYMEGANGQKQREGPHDGKEELKLSMQWKTKRELHVSKLWSEYEKRRDRLLDYAERLEQCAGSRFKAGHDDSPPDEVYDLYESLQEDVEAAKNIIASINPEDAGWLAGYIRERTVQDRDEASKEIDQELESICPPRDVKAFCVVVVKDTRTFKYPPKRTAQVTVWDVPDISALEGCAQSPFVPGQRYLVTNLIPTQASAWMDSPLGGEVYLTTRKNSRWTMVN